MKSKAQNLSERLRNAIDTEGPRLASLSEAEAAVRGANNEGWSPKQELGHLIGSATNNRVRFVVAALERAYTGPTYDGPGWVKIGGYADSSWVDLVDLWMRSNQALARAIEHIPEERFSAPCKIGGGDEVTLDFLIEDYVLHMQHHLDHILSRDQLTTYPGAFREPPL